MSNGKGAVWEAGHRWALGCARLEEWSSSSAQVVEHHHRGTACPWGPPAPAQAWGCGAALEIGIFAVSMGARGRESLGCSSDPRALPSCIPSSSRMSPVVRGGLRGPHPLGNVPGVSAGDSPGTPKSQKDATTSPNPSHGFSAPCGALPPPHPALLCALGGGEAPPERLAWQLLWQPHIFLGIPNDLLAFAVIYSFFFFFGCRRLTSLPSAPKSGRIPCGAAAGVGLGELPRCRPTWAQLCGEQQGQEPPTHICTGQGPNPSCLYPWGG